MDRVSPAADGPHSTYELKQCPYSWHEGVHNKREDQRLNGPFELAWFWMRGQSIKHPGSCEARHKEGQERYCFGGQAGRHDVTANAGVKWPRPRIRMKIPWRFAAVHLND